MYGSVDKGLMAEAWEVESFRDVYLPTRLHLISGRCLPALAWSAKGRFLNGQSRVIKGMVSVGLRSLAAGGKPLEQRVSSPAASS